jgi:hypothetical protein
MTEISSFRNIVFEKHKTMENFQNNKHVYVTQSSEKRNLEYCH